jgi:tetratricopeptide (TPR) repeat protein
MSVRNSQDSTVTSAGIDEANTVDFRFARRAETLIEAGQLERAYDLLQAGIEEYPDYSTGYQVLGDLYLKRGNNISATFAYFESLKRDPDNALTLMRLGDIFRSEGQLDEARKYYEDALRCDPCAEPLLERLGHDSDALRSELQGAFMTETAADLYRQQGLLDRAQAIYEHLSRHSPHSIRLPEKLQG